ncbi:RsmB/NOP family class I SAM-dependent RNA methyltransferase [Pelagibacterium montanilacus]|uniref:RsmB/NOP family class I SAM-dependent RNA methyltransferase n=1 Tax=Pelagibacterium montanilacus TaxID=2185280 RepID=UPI000F8D1CE4|nr:RsmB/NOP family class I SAM-dependent RNA methyltransferase [Pelagibacterium montanilacus]
MLRGAPFVPFGAERFPDGRDRALANRLVTVALRRHGHISAVLDAMLDKGLPGRSGVLEAALRIGIAQLLFIEDVPAHSAVHLAVETVRADRRAGRFDKLANAVLRGADRRREEFTAQPEIATLPPRRAERWADQYGADAPAAFARALLAGAPLDLTFRADDPELVARLGATPLLGRSVRVPVRDAAVHDLAGFAEGQWWVQDVAATLPALLLGAKPGMRVVDLCAAPGGKTAQLAALGGEVTAIDLDPARLERLASNLDRLGLKARLETADVLTYRPEAPFDAVLLDAPCSATGTFRRHPEVLLNRTDAGIADRVGLQREMIGAAHGMLAPGGVLVYCVCSLEASEGEEQMGWALETFPDLALSPVTADELHGWAAPITREGAVRTTPALALPGAVEGGMDGFFAARFIKR